MEMFAEYLNWEEISLHQQFSTDFAKRHETQMDWDRLFLNQKLWRRLPEKFLEEYDSKLGPDGWYEISKNQILSEPFIRKYCEQVDWRRISRYQQLSEHFIEEMSEFVYWPEISRYQRLTESFILRHLQDVSCEDIICGQTLSLDFYSKLLKLGVSRN